MRGYIGVMWMMLQKHLKQYMLDCTALEEVCTCILQVYFLSHITVYYTFSLLSPQITSGQITISTPDPTSDLNGDSPQFTLTCISTGGPATTVTWTRDSTIVIEDYDTVLVNAVTAQYTHTLNVTAAGEYTCTVANSVSSRSADIRLEGMIHTVCVAHTSLFSVTLCTGTSPPGDVVVVQHGLTSIIVTWTASSDATGYRIHYISDSDSGSREVGVSATSLTLSGLKNGETYSISIVATSTDRPTSSPITRDVTLCERESVCVCVCVCMCVKDYQRASMRWFVVYIH